MKVLKKVLTFFTELAVFFKEVGTPEFWPEVETETGAITAY